MISQSVNITFAGTNSVVFNRPVQQITLLDSSNQQFLRQLMLSNDGVRIIKGQYSVNIPAQQLFAVAFAASPSMSWAPIIVTDVTSSVFVTPNTISLATASMNITASDEAGTDMTYQWFWSSSYLGNWTIPSASANVTFSGTNTPAMKALFAPITGGFDPNPTYFRCVVSNPAGPTSSSVCTLSASLA